MARPLEAPRPTTRPDALSHARPRNANPPKTYDALRTYETELAQRRAARGTDPRTGELAERVTRTEAALEKVTAQLEKLIDALSK